MSLKAMELLEAHRQRRRMEWLGALVNQVPDEIYLFDLNTLALVHANNAASKHLTVDHGEVKLHGLTFELAASEIEAHLCVLKDGAEEVSFQTCVPRAAGRIPVEVRWQRLSTSGHALFMCTLRDISQWLALEQAKSEFISVVSHELRTPVTGLYGAIKLLGNGDCGKLPPDAAYMVGLASSAADDLLTLVNDILDLEKTTVGLMTFDIKPLAIGPMLDALILGHQGMATQAGVFIKNVAPAPVVVMADAQRLRQVLVNLISNAIKFAPAGSTITLNAFTQADGRARITVTDQGSGVPEDFQPRLFERFAQAKTETTRPHGGSGLGLSIVKSMTEAMGGSVACMSQPGCTEFTVDLPQAEQVFS
ncbi:MAG: HAMP domain-containing histidine kinase [Polaromonas sp.]|nr:HAMP domain-containing histidine kinase [Polaromonas sp.]